MALSLGGAAATSSAADAPAAFECAETHDAPSLEELERLCAAAALVNSQLVEISSLLDRATASAENTAAVAERMRAVFALFKELVEAMPIPGAA